MRYVILVVLLGPAIVLGVAVVIATAYGTLEAPYHPATLLPIVVNYAPALLIALGLGAGLGLLLARVGDAVESFDPDHPPALLRIAARWGRALRSPVSDLVDKGIVAYRTRTRSPSPAHSRSRYAPRAHGLAITRVPGVVLPPLGQVPFPASHATVASFQPERPARFPFNRQAPIDTHRTPGPRHDPRTTTR